MTKIQKIEIKEVYVPKIRLWEVQIPTLDLIYKPVVDIPACVDAHRNNLTGLINEDELGTYQACGTFNIPSFEPLDYNPANFQYTAPTTQQQQEQEQTQQQPESQITQKKKEEIEIVPCPGQKDQRVGDFRNEKRLERVIGHEKSEDGTRCITIYEDVPFKDQYIPEVSTIVSTAVIGLVAASSPLLLNIVKPLVKNIVKKLTKKKDKVE